MSNHQASKPNSKKPNNIKFQSEQPLLSILVTHASQKGHTLTDLAKALGVTYTRLAQWRRGDAHISTASKFVYGNAAKYLGIPAVFVAILAGVFNLEDFVWPSTDALSLRLTRELARMRQDPYIGAFMPASIETAPQDIKLFVAFLFNELAPESIPGHRAHYLISALQASAMTHSPTASPGKSRELGSGTHLF